MKLIAVYTTLSQHEDARRIAGLVVERKLAACARLWAIESLYRWQGALHADAEWCIEFKTTAARYAELEAALRELHPYELPAIHAVAIEQVFAPYAAWVEEGSAGE